MYYSHLLVDLFILYFIIFPSFSHLSGHAKTETTKQKMPSSMLDTSYHCWSQRSAWWPPRCWGSCRGGTWGRACGTTSWSDLLGDTLTTSNMHSVNINKNGERKITDKHYLKSLKPALSSLTTTTEHDSTSTIWEIENAYYWVLQDKETSWSAWIQIPPALQETVMFPSAF
jgi:hypothetical protein